MRKGNEVIVNVLAGELLNQQKGARFVSLTNQPVWVPRLTAEHRNESTLRGFSLFPIQTSATRGELKKKKTGQKMPANTLGYLYFGGVIKNEKIPSNTLHR